MKKSCILLVVLLGLVACGQVVPKDTTTTTATAIAAEPIDYPASYKDAPDAYKLVLDQLYKLIQTSNRKPPQEETEEQRAISERLKEAMLFSPTPYDVASKIEGFLGYAVKDINNDGVPELLILARDNGVNEDSEELFIYELYTLKDNEPLSLGTYWRDYQANIAADGTIYIDKITYLSEQLYFYELDAGAAELTLLYYYDGTRYYQIIDGEANFITRNEFEELKLEYINQPNQMKFSFIPVEQGATP